MILTLDLDSSTVNNCLKFHLPLPRAAFPHDVLKTFGGSSVCLAVAVSPLPSLSPPRRPTTAWRPRRPSAFFFPGRPRNREGDRGRERETQAAAASGNRPIGGRVAHWRAEVKPERRSKMDLATEGQIWLSLGLYVCYHHCQGTFIPAPDIKIGYCWWDPEYLLNIANFSLKACVIPASGRLPLPVMDSCNLVERNVLQSIMLV